MESLSLPKPGLPAGVARMVEELLKRSEIVYLCEICGFGYKQLEAAEQCEEYCGTHGKYSAELHKQAVSKPTVRVMLLAA